MTSQLLDIAQAATVRDNALGQLGHERSATAVARASLEAKTSVERMKPHGDRPGGHAQVAWAADSAVLERKQAEVQAAEEAAAKIGTKMIFPLTLCLFPSFFLVAIGPAVIRLVEAFKTLNIH